MGSSSGYTPASRLNEWRLAGLEAGTIVCDRFCILEPAGAQEAAVATDLKRELGASPGHRVHIAACAVSGAFRAIAHLAVRSCAFRNAVAVVDVPGGLVVAFEPLESPLPVMGFADKPAEVRIVLASSLVQAATELAEVGLFPSWRDDAVIVEGARCVFSSLAPLVAGGDAQASQRSLVALIEQLNIDLEDSATQSLAGLRDRFAGLSRKHRIDGREVLPRVAPFVKRGNYQGQLGAALAMASVAQAQFVVLEGERGVGKTRLLRFFAEEARPRVVALDTRYYIGPDARTGLIGALELIPSICVGWAPVEISAIRERLARVQKNHRAVMSKVLPLLAAWIGDARRSNIRELASVERDAFVEVISAVIRAVGTSERPLLLQIDNVHWIDSGAAAVLKTVFRDRVHHTLVVGTAWQGHPCGDIVTSNFQVTRFARKNTEDLLKWALPDGEACQHLPLALQTASQGNPLALWTTLQHWLADGTVARDDSGRWVCRDLPTSADVVDMFRHRVELCGADPQWLAIIAHLGGGVASHDWLAGVTGWDSARIVRACDGLVGAGISSDSDGGIEFVHETARETIVDMCAADERRRAHSAISNWLDGGCLDASEEQRARHAELARDDTEPDGDLAHLHLEAARKTLGVFDLERAQFHGERALIRAAGQYTKLEARRLLGDVALLEGEVDGAIALYERSIADAESVEYAAHVLADAMYSLNSVGGADAIFELARRTLGRLDRALPMNGFGRAVSIARSLFQVVTGWVRTPKNLRDPLCSVYTVVASSAAADPGLFLVAVCRGAALSKGAPSQGAATVLGFWAGVWAGVGRYGTARQILKRALAYAIHGGPWTIGVVKHLQAQWVEHSMGHYHEGQKLLGEAATLFEDSGDQTIAPLTYFFMASYGREREHVATLNGWIESAQGCARRHGGEFAMTQVSALQLLVRARAGEPVSDGLVELSRRIDDTQPVPPDEVVARALLAHSWIELGDPARAWEQVERGLDRIAPGPVLEALLDLHCAGALAWAHGIDLDRKGRRRARSMLRRVKSSRGRSKRCALYYDYIIAVQAKAAGKLQAARAGFATLVATLPEHGESHLGMKAHLSLAELISGDDIIASAEHRRVARELFESLGLSPESAPQRVISQPVVAPLALALPSSTSPSNEGAGSVTVAELLASVQGVLEEAPDTSVEPVALEEQGKVVRVRGQLDALSTLVIRLVVAARDACASIRTVAISFNVVRISEERAAEISGGEAGLYVGASVRVTGRRANTMPASLSPCHRHAASVDAVVIFEGDDMGACVTAFLPLDSNQSVREPSSEDDFEEISRVRVLRAAARRGK